MCADHAEQARAEREQRRAPGRPSAAGRGYGAGYREARAALARVIREMRSTGCDVRCVICGSVIHTSEPWTAEHKIPLRHGGSNDLANLGPAHARCNYGWRASP